jgi:hypothetical protein
MASRITVRLTGAIGLDDADRLLDKLTKETGLDWRGERPADGRNLGAWDLLLTAVISGAVGKGGEAAAGVVGDHVRKVVNQWKDRRLDPPDAEVETREVPVERSEAETPAEAETAD